MSLVLWNAITGCLSARRYGCSGRGCAIDRFAEKTQLTTERFGRTGKTVLAACGLFKAASIYFANVFGTGIPVAPIRVVWPVPQLGERVSELIEMPLIVSRPRSLFGLRVSY